MYGVYNIIRITRVRLEYSELFRELALVLERRVKIQPASEVTHHIPRQVLILMVHSYSIHFQAPYCNLR